MKFSETAISLRMKDFFMSRFSPQRYKKDETVIQANDLDDHIYIVLSGTLVALHLNENGKYLQLKRFQKNDIVGYYASLAHKSRSATVTALKETEVIKIPSQEFYKFITEDPQNTHEIISYLGGELHEQTQRYKELGLLSVQERVASYLLRLVNPNQIINFDQSRQEIAEYLGMSRETFSRTLATFQESGYLSHLSSRSYRLSNRMAIENILST